MESPKRKRDSEEDTRDSQRHLPKYVRMQDVVKLPFPLTWFWRSGEYAEMYATTAGGVTKNSAQPKSATQRAIDSAFSTNHSRPWYRDGSNCDIPLFGKPAAKEQPMRSTRCPAEYNISNSTPIATKSKSSTPVAASATPITTPRHHTIKNRKFEPGTVPIPQEIQGIHSVIRNCVRHPKSGMPVRPDLRKKVPEHFATVTGYLKASSSLNDWLGDTRLFTREEWYYLKGWSREEGRKSGGGGEVHGAEKVLGGDSDAKTVVYGGSDIDG